MSWCGVVASFVVFFCHELSSNDILRNSCCGNIPIGSDVFCLLCAVNYWQLIIYFILCKFNIIHTKWNAAVAELPFPISYFFSIYSIDQCTILRLASIETKIDSFKRGKKREQENHQSGKGCCSLSNHVQREHTHT